MLLRIGIVCLVIFLGSCLIARQIALGKNHRPEVIIAAGIIVGALVFAALWTVSLVYQPLYTKIAGAIALAVMPAIAAWIAPERKREGDPPAKR